VNSSKDVEEEKEVPPQDVLDANKLVDEEGEEEDMEADEESASVNSKS